MDNINIIFYGDYSFENIFKRENPLYEKAGVYLWTIEHKGFYNIVYVGECDKFRKRFDQHNKSFNKSTEYFVIPHSDDDLYSLMRGTEPDFYCELYKLNKFWYDKLVDNPEPWVSEFSIRYRDNLKIFLLVSDANQQIGELNEIERKSLQTQIQRSLRKVHNIKYYNIKKPQSWLGKEDLVKNYKYLDIKFDLINIPPQLENKAYDILSRLYDYAEENKII